jgi:hypothetical protein
VEGATVCPTHGGAARQVKEAGRRRQEERRIGKLLAAQPLRPVGNPLDGLLELTAEVVRWKDFMSARLDVLEEMRFTDAKGAEQLRSEVALFERALDRAGRFLLDVAKLNVDERLARLADAQVAQVVMAFRVFVMTLGLDPTDSKVAPALRAGLLALRPAGLPDTPGPNA